MRAFSFTTHIDRPAREVWDYVIDLAQSSRWRPMTRSMETEDGRPIHVGQKLRVTLEVLGKVMVRESETREFEPPRRWVVRSEHNGVEGFFEYVVEPERGGARVTLRCDVKAHAFLPWLFLPLICSGERRNRREQLDNLKRAIEGTPP